MPALNRVQLIGRLGRDPEVRVTPNERKVTQFSIAVNRFWTDEDGERREATDWFTIEAWGKLGEICEQYLSKGRLIYVEGRLQNDRWEDEKGEARSRIRIIAQEMQMLDRPGEASEVEAAV
ncbi:MAG: single-stranded DNA-binding protein [Anaerolineae bacterium]|nr:single-stranded DNA-binding protein [Anaerolineae bacterium]MDW8097925.1 single-stranded DNA-binding protein [Anaerolineae bacterium]